MGWLFGWDTRKQLVDHLNHPKGANYKVLKSCCVGNNLWQVIEGTDNEGKTFRTVVLCIMRGRNHSLYGWGYKDIDEGMGPVAVNCPLSYLSDLTEPRSYAAEWREKVREYWAKRNRKLEPGTKIRVYGNEYEITGRPYRNRDYSVKDSYGSRYRLRTKDMVNAEVLS